MMLNILETLPMREYGPNSVEALHAMIEAKKLAYADMQRYVADPRFSDVPVERDAQQGLRTGDERRSVDPTAAQSPSGRRSSRSRRRHDVSVRGRPRRQHGVADPEQLRQLRVWRRRRRNRIPASESRRAVHARPHRIRTCSRRASGRCTRSSPRSCATEHTRIAFGIMGGWNQSQAHAQFVSNIVDHGMNIQAALEAPRFTKLTFEGLDVGYGGAHTGCSPRTAWLQRATRSKSRGLLQLHGRRAGSDADGRGQLRSLRSAQRRSGGP